MKTLKKLKPYMGGKKILFNGSLVSSAVSAILNLMPYLFIWLIIREIFNSTSSSQSKIVTYSIYAVITSISGIALYFLALTLSHLAAFRTEVEIRKTSMEKILRMPLGFFDANTSGKIRKVIDENASITHTFLAHQLPDLAGTLITPVIIIISLFIFEWRLGLACIIPMILAVSIMTLMMGGKGQSFMKIYMDSLEDMNNEAVEYVRGIPVVKVFQQTVYSFKNFHKSIKKYKNYVSNYTKLWENPMSLYTIIINGFIFFLVPTSILLINNTNNYKYLILNLIFYALITPLLSQCIMRSMHMNQAFWETSEAINRIEALVDFQLLPISNNSNISTTSNINFENVVFKYPNAKENAINNISFSINEGETIALVGSSGSGKSTIAKLIPRFWDVLSGEIKIGGINVKKYNSENLMKKISFVFQNTKLFKSTILENVKYGKPNASIKDINTAIDLAQCREIIDKLPDGLDTLIGSEGVYLSGGEQQRIALARAILKDSPIIVLDEATAFADPENEYLIQKALKKLTEGKTVIMIAHRLTSIKDVDNILVIDKGKIVESGTHNNLINKNGVYFNMWKEYSKAVNWQIREEAIN